MDRILLSWFQYHWTLERRVRVCIAPKKGWAEFGKLNAAWKRYRPVLAYWHLINYGPKRECFSPEELIRWKILFPQYGENYIHEGSLLPQSCSHQWMEEGRRFDVLFFFLERSGRGVEEREGEGRGGRGGEGRGRDGREGCFCSKIAPCHGWGAFTVLHQPDNTHW